jgi:hypothetical protein
MRTLTSQTALRSFKFTGLVRCLSLLDLSSAVYSCSRMISVLTQIADRKRGRQSARALLAWCTRWVREHCSRGVRDVCACVIEAYVHPRTYTSLTTLLVLRCGRAVAAAAAAAAAAAGGQAGASHADHSTGTGKCMGPAQPLRCHHMTVLVAGCWPAPRQLPPLLPPPCSQPSCPRLSAYIHTHPRPSVRAPLPRRAGHPLSRRDLEAALRPFLPELTKEQAAELAGPEALGFEELKDLLVDCPPQVGFILQDRCSLRLRQGGLR